MNVRSPTSARDLIATLISERVNDVERERLFAELIAQPITADLLAAGVGALRDNMIPVVLSADAIDTCGTGGSGKKTINTSTITAFIVAACGGKVAKHGNRSASGNCGCFDLLEKLEVNIDLTPVQEQKIFQELGIAFLFAPLHHPALRFIAPLRKKHGKKTIFNLLGPLCNPAGISRQLIGTGDDVHGTIIAGALQRLGSFNSMVVTGHDGLDEVSICSDTTVRQIHRDSIDQIIFSPEDIGVPKFSDAMIVGGTSQENADIFLQLAQGKADEAKKNLVLVNAAHALTLSSSTSSLQAAFSLAERTLTSGAVFELFTRYRDFSRSM